MRRLLLTTLLIGAWFFSACHPRDAGKPGPHDTHRIVSMAPSLTEALFALQSGSQVVGVTNYCTYPPEALQKEKIGDFINPSIEKIVSLNPTLVLAERWSSSKVVSRLRKLGLNVVETISPLSLPEIYQQIAEVGQATGKSKLADSLIQEMRKQVEEIRRRGENLPRRPTVYVEIDVPSWTVGRNSFITDAISVCGGNNIFGDVARPALQASVETILDRNPEIILTFQATAAEIRHRPGWSNLRAVRNGNVIDDLKPNRRFNGSLRLVEGLRDFQERIIKWGSLNGDSPQLIIKWGLKWGQSPKINHAK
ncbi:MAG TPA: cobalamin-binding protein [Acidobacteriota bacterium]